MRTPHYSRVADEPEALNPITGRSVYYGMRPWRCDDRFCDWLKSFTMLDSLSVQRSILRTFYRCARAESGNEPKDDYYRLSRAEVMYYTERSRCGMMRERLWETYPYDLTEVRRVGEDDGLKMRVWRHQRELELESREGKVDDALRASIFSSSWKER